jgi:sugar lactone lactonase YvrE
MRLAALSALTALLASAQPNPYRTIEHWYALPAGRTMGSTSSVFVAPNGHIWIADRCGVNSCEGSKLDPIMEFDASGKLLKSFGAGMFVFPHCLVMDKDGALWICDGQPPRATPETKGRQVFKVNQDGKVLMTLGKTGIGGEGPDVFDAPNALAIAPNGDIFISDGHSPNRGNARVMKFSKDGKFIKQWGGHGSDKGQFEVPHTLAFDSKGRLFVGDRANNRIQIFDQEGKFLEEWKQFSRPSGIFIDRNDVMYVTDSESTDNDGYGHNPGWKRGIRVGSARTGNVVTFIPDPAPGGATSGAEGLTADDKGVIYGAEVGPKDVKKYVKQ